MENKAREIWDARKTLSWATRTSAPFAIDRTGITIPCTNNDQRLIRPMGLGSIEYIISGSGTVTENGKVFHVKAGDVFILHQGEYHDYYPDPNDKWTKLWVQTAGYAISDVIRAYNLDKVNHIPDFDIENDILEIQKIINESTDIEVINTQGTHLLISLLQKLQAEVLLRNSNNNSNNNNTAREIRRFIDVVPGANITLEELAEEFSYSKQHLIRVFKQKYKITPYEYILDRRIEIARSLLTYSELSVAQISDELHFCDVSYFIDFFKKRTGVTPHEFKSNIIMP